MTRPAVRATIKPSLEVDVQSALSTKVTLNGMARYAIPSDKAYGVAMKDMKALGKKLGRNHELAAALWDTDVYEARMVCSFVEDPTQITPAQMDRWCKDFDNWAICDTMCFNLFDRTPHAWAKVKQWSKERGEFQKRTAFALLWSLSMHDKRAHNEQFVRGLLLIERAADDDRNFVKKAVNMALRAIGKRNRALNAAAIAFGPAPCGLTRRRGALDWKRRASGAHDSRGDQAHQGGLVKCRAGQFARWAVLEPATSAM